MDYHKLDPDLITWGVAIQQGRSWEVRASRSHGDAEIDAHEAGGMLVYYNPDGWKFAATGNHVPYGR